jgi:hypothetical protein
MTRNNKNVFNDVGTLGLVVYHAALDQQCGAVLSRHLVL